MAKNFKSSRLHRRVTAPVLALSVGAMLVFSAAPAGADSKDPLGDLVGKLQQQVNTLTKNTHLDKVLTPQKQSAAKASVPSSDAPNPPSSDDDTSGHETTNPTAPDHASSYLGHVKLLNQGLASLGDSNSTVKDDDETTADTTVLAVAGQEITGSHAKSDGSPADEDSVLAPLTDPVCTTLGGMVCLDVLYSEAHATENGTTSNASSKQGVAKACVGGSDPTGATCNGLVNLGAASSNSSVTRNQVTGRTTGASHSDVASVCLVPGALPILPCALNAGALSSDTTGDSDPAPTRSSSVLALGTAQGQGLNLNMPQGLNVPLVLGAFLNQGESYQGSQLVGAAQQALDVSLLGLPGIGNLADVGLGHSEVLVHNDGGEPPVNPPGGCTTDCPGGPGGPGGGGNGGNGGDNGNGNNAGPAAAADSTLPNTGGPWLGLLSISLLCLGAGATIVAWDRRKVITA